jgi:pimeloyl-ACP methyl ester carboxylesterase
MREVLDRWLRRPRTQYRRLPSLVLINGLAEQAESWFCNRRHWEADFDVKLPELIVYDGRVLHKRIENDEPITVPFLTDQLELYLDNFVQTPPYNLVASSLGAQLAVEYAARHPETVGKLVLICPSGFGGEERLPVVEGVRKNDFQSLVASVFHDHRFVHPAIVRHIERQFANRRWRKGLLRTIRGTSGHCVREKLATIKAPVLLLLGEQDNIVDSDLAFAAVRDLANYQVVAIPSCGHAPQIERAPQVNRLVLEFMLRSEPVATHQESTESIAKPSYVAQGSG